MKIKLGTVLRDRTAYGNQFYIQIEDNKVNSNGDLSDLEGKKVTVVIGDVCAIDDLIQQTEVL